MMETVGEVISRKLNITNNGVFTSPDDFYPILLETAIEIRVNIFRTNIDYIVDDGVQIHKCVLLTDNIQLFSSLRLKSGKFLTAKDTQHGNYFLSNVNSVD
ncbi:hypothetical protein HQN90_37240 [Paenibacillus alba]|uniref:hypothetical protein n=1 Tax=Paenibacillus alba TaxID=1197127 RepID=UPI001567BE22|nr:hypothetical protein [Paenibacillus alba]NQX71735.1 hypothetical protein [Paenibacillus alba]